MGWRRPLAYAEQPKPNRNNIMKIYSAAANAPFLGMFNHLAILGANRAAAGASDFTDADTSQTITIETPADGDVVTYPGALAYTKIAFVGTGLTAVTLDVGFDGGEEFLKDGAMFARYARIAPLSTLAPKIFTGSILLTAKVDTTGANLSAITAGEIWIYYNIVRIADVLKNPVA